ncbi:TetR family transcriptional regulator [Caldicellulosiruptor bescii]|uniref:Transcriptional regulator, TetR family n=2 Tax=Caldicellulosiruptor bescii TaxID=31899 RepID=B9MM65_CALBD|nr:TetR/AcrR family transcriptional regulator [Caldicellulosiruptor bescii]ACM61288.1 transcriptional regulator, TetR family [Caldicellulosiruptor bescii DSM 6725]PBC88899.1 TetR family transcriptional regulator [Caldicellulosiruptor bescii]PBC91619.1 TetR family transcriptional regulator [Caldicellulosiruptor bescii]PBD02968.1 TetR family transcriptional regulator [Caldicellulosiruptor bescii]PBD07416.1 TetR family transcriptional regulator [Caldicellulosiruptor bescii]
MLLRKEGRKREQKKIIKENRLLEAAYNLFIEKGITATAIDEIVKKAGVAKGTFYLYFKDKEDILEKLILKKSSEIVKKALQEVSTREFSSSVDKFLYFLEYIIDYLSRNRVLFKFLKKDFSWVFYKKITENEQFAELKRAKEMFLKNFNTNYTQEELEIVVFMILELVSSLTYSSIVNDEPAPIEKVKPLLLSTIRKILEN